jgi:hypothetical protein
MPRIVEESSSLNYKHHAHASDFRDDLLIVPSLLIRLNTVECNIAHNTRLLALVERYPEISDPQVVRCSTH